MDGRHGSAQQPTPRVLCSPPSFLFSRCILGACILALCHFSIVWGLGSKAWLVSLPSPTLPGEVRMELPHSAHQPRARVLCLLLGQASSVKSPGWKPQSIQPSAASSRSSLLPPHPPPRLFAGRAQSPVGDGLGGVFITPPSPRAPPACAWRGWDPVWLSLPGGHCTGMADSHGHSGVSPSRQCPATLASARPARSRALHGAPLGAGTTFPFPHLPIPGKAGSEHDVGSIQHSARQSPPLQKHSKHVLHHVKP